VQRQSWQRDQKKTVKLTCIGGRTARCTADNLTGPEAYCHLVDLIARAPSQVRDAEGDAGDAPGVSGQGEAGVALRVRVGEAQDRKE
jgi:hypothetical protein